MAFRLFHRTHYADPPAGKQETPGSVIKLLLTVAVGAWLLRSFVVASFYIPSGSMLPTMKIGDYLFISKWPYGYSAASFPFGFPSFDGRILGSTPMRGDIVVFEGPEGADVVKRVMGIPGDTIAVDGGRVILNGKSVPRERIEDIAIEISPNSPCRVVPPAVAMARPIADGRMGCVYPAYREALPGGPSFTVLDQTGESPADNFGPVTVPEGRLFLMGDNRDDSMDSRYPVEVGGMGLVPLDKVVGRAERAFWSTDGSASWINPLSWFSALRTDRIGTDYHP